MLESAKARFTTRDGQQGYMETKAALQAATLEELRKGYLEGMRDCFGMFGGNASRFQNLVAEELLSRGEESIPNIFGSIPVVSTWKGPQSRRF